MSRAEIFAAIGANFSVAAGVLGDLGWYCTSFACFAVAVCCGIAIAGITA